MAKQSANTLFHFLNNISYLESILNSGSLSPRYCEEVYDFLPEDFPHLIFPMKCFCDIYLEKLNLHCEDYGGFGIGLDRDFLLGKGVQPVQYINEKSDLKEQLYKAAKDSLQNYDNIISEQFYKSDLFSRLKYSKPLVASVRNQKKEERSKFLPDEKEWRYVPSYEKLDNISPFLNPAVTTNRKIEESNKIESINQAKIAFFYDNINYLVVPNDNDRDALIDFIWEDLFDDTVLKNSTTNNAMQPDDKSDYILKNRLKLISKIIVLNRMRNDM